MNVFKWALLLAFSTWLSSCAWVNPTEGGEQVRQLTADQAQHCRKAGTTHVSVLGKIGVIRRADRRVADELVTLASNSAAQLGGNAIVPLSEVEDGHQSFAVYECKPQNLP